MIKRYSRKYWKLGRVGLGSRSRRRGRAIRGRLVRRNR